MFAGGRKAKRQGKGKDGGGKGTKSRRKAGTLDTDALSFLIGSAPAAAPGATATAAGVQAKSEGKSHEDPLEKEADAAAKRVTQASAEAAGKKKQALKERALEEEKKEKKKPQMKAEDPEREEKEEVQAKAEPSAGPSAEGPSAGGGEGGRAGEPLPARLEAERGKGSPMDSGTRDMMESGFGADFGEVRIHTDQQAAEMSRELRAQAFTLGNDVYFNDSRYNPATEEGRRLLAHELAHVLQQKPTPEAERPASPET